MKRSKIYDAHLDFQLKKPYQKLRFKKAQRIKQLRSIFSLEIVGE